ncbi:hypothetical protein H8S23_01055 [Anaerofilum sp. BX8]|uniref:Uncharacterized protein n=1 Tax=Anaerofilum hominis TaxID=2763016 RepID=A0A923I4B9_9FIRM|nr:hypothetical protein [Anaerofilum hominis]MBC5580090.1 hypothetical protein [Anaerofilum hominis]
MNRTSLFTLARAENGENSAAKQPAFSIKPDPDKETRVEPYDFSAAQVQTRGAIHTGLRPWFSPTLHPKSWGSTAQRRKGGNWGCSARQTTAGILYGWQSGLTQQCAPIAPFAVMFPYSDTAKTRRHRKIRQAHYNRPAF